MKVLGKRKNDCRLETGSSYYDLLLEILPILLMYCYAFISINIIIITIWFLIVAMQRPSNAGWHMISIFSCPILSISSINPEHYNCRSGLDWTNMEYPFSSSFPIYRGPFFFPLSHSSIKLVLSSADSSFRNF